MNFFKFLPPPLLKFEKDLAILVGKYQIKRLYLFGSVLTQSFKILESDVDILVEFEEEQLKPEEIGENCLNFSWEIEQILGRKVDVLRNRTFKNPYFQKSLDRSKVLIYERKRTEISL